MGWPGRQVLFRCPVGFENRLRASPGDDTRPVDKAWVDGVGRNRAISAKRARWRRRGPKHVDIHGRCMRRENNELVHLSNGGANASKLTTLKQVGSPEQMSAKGPGEVMKTNLREVDDRALVVGVASPQENIGDFLSPALHVVARRDLRVRALEGPLPR
jgi:hypothetical protein